MTRTLPSRIPPRLLGLLLAATTVGAAISLFSVQWCRSNGWSDPQQHIYMCYSDFSLLFTERGLAEGLFPFVDSVPPDQVMEYPVLISLVAGALAQAVLALGPAHPEAQTLLFHDLNVLAVIGCWLGTVLVTAVLTQRRGEALMVALAPGIILTLNVNWDMWAVFLGAFGLLLWARGRSGWAGILLGLGAAMKLYPLFFLGAILVLCVRAGRIRSFLAVLLASAVTWLMVNLPFMLTSFEQWATFYRFSSERDVSFSSMWLAFVWTGWSGETFSLISNGLFLLCCLGIAWLGWAAPLRPRAGQLCFLIVASFLLLGKVYSPQFVMWLIPLVVLASPRLRQFVIWQAAEVFHWASVWLISAKITSEEAGGSFGQGHLLFEVLYGLGVLAHMAALIWLVVRVVRDILHPEEDPVRRQEAGEDESSAETGVDPLAGPTAGRPDAFALPGLGRETELRLRW